MDKYKRNRTINFDTLKDKRRTVESLTCKTRRARAGCISPLRTKGSTLLNSQSPVERQKHKVWKRPMKISNCVQFGDETFFVFLVILSQFNCFPCFRYLPGTTNE